MIGVLIPAHEEAERIGACLASVKRAARHPALRGEPVQIVVVADACTDATAWHCRAAGVEPVLIEARCVGAARALAAAQLMEAGARWLACTDADSQVPADWLAAQLGCGHPVFCGVVDLLHDTPTVMGMEDCHAMFHAGERWGEGHGRIHGANLGIDVACYRRAGGFEPVRCHEDVGLVRRAQARGASVCWAGRPRVMTSARLEGRAPQGFAAHLRALQADLLAGGRTTAEVALP